MNTLSRLAQALLLLFVSIGCAFRSHAGTIIAGVDAGEPRVRAFTTPGQFETRSFLAYPATFTGGVRVATGDVNGDGVQDIITAPGPGVAPLVKIFDGFTGAESRSFNAYLTDFTGGVFVAAGDINGDGTDDIITGMDAGTFTSEVRVFSGTDLTLLGAFAPYDIGFTGGVRVAVGDVNGDGTPDIITGAGTNSPHVKVFHGQTRAELASFIAYTPAFTGGVFVAAGDVNGDGAADIITGPGAGGTSEVKVFNGRTRAQLRSFFAYDIGFSGGVRVGSTDVNNDGRTDIVTVPGSGRRAEVKTFNGRNGGFMGFFTAFDPGFTGGVFVGGVVPPPIVATTDPATNITINSATLNGTVNPNDRSVRVRFQYGPTTSYGKTVTADPAEVTGSAPTPVSADIQGLQPGKTYHFRVVVTDGLGGTVVGADRTFTTTVNLPPSGGTFTVTPGSPVASRTVLTATFSGWTDPEGHTPLSYEVREGSTIIAVAGTDNTPQFTLPPGTHLLTGRIYDSLGAFTDTAEVVVVVTGDPESEPIAVSRDPVPGAGTLGTGIPANATWANFGVPAIADGSVKYLGFFASSTGRGGGIFSDGTPVALVGQPVPGAGAAGPFSIPSGATFKRFKDPVTDAAGNVAFIATMGGTGVSGANDTVVVSNGHTGGALEVIAREGFDAPGTSGARYANFLSASIGGQGSGGTIFNATLKGARATENRGAWWLPTGAPSAILLIQKGGPGFASDETIKSYALHQAWPATPGHGRGQLDGNEAFLQVGLTRGKQAIVLATPGNLEAIARTGDSVDGVSSVWVRMAQPSSSDDGSFLSVRATIRPDSAPAASPGKTALVTSANGGTNWSVLAQVGDTAPGTDSPWIDLGYPVNSPTGAGLALIGKVRGGSAKAANDTGIWWRPGSGTLTLLVREGSQAVGCAEGVKFVAFQSLAFAGGEPGPIFVAKVAGPGVNGTNDLGVWAVDASGSVRLLFREGDQVDGKKLRSFTVLSTVNGSPGVTRAFNDNGQVAWRANFTDRTTAIVVTQIP